MKKREIEAYCGDISQLFGIDECVLANGRNKGTRAYLINNGSGLMLMALRDKCLAIPYLSFKGMNIGFVCKNGISAPEFYQEEGTRGFLRNFEGGFLTTCGLQYSGAPSETEGQKNGLHGVISNTPLENVNARVFWNHGEPDIVVEGDAREGYLFGPNLVIHKRLVIKTGMNRIEIHDSVENKDFQQSTLMLLYHFNYGYPFLDENSKIYTNYDHVEPRDKGSEGRLGHLESFSKPIDNFQEIVAVRTMSEESEQVGKTLVYNPAKQVAVQMTLDPRQLPVMNEWQSPRSGDYVLGMEPGTGSVGGLISSKEQNLLMYIGPNEEKHFDIVIDFIDNVETIHEMLHTL